MVNNSSTELWFVSNCVASFVLLVSWRFILLSHYSSEFFFSGLVLSNWFTSARFRPFSRDVSCGHFNVFSYSKLHNAGMWLVARFYTLSSEVWSLMYFGDRNCTAYPRSGLIIGIYRLFIMSGCMWTIFLVISLTSSLLCCLPHCTNSSFLVFHFQSHNRVFVI